MLNKKLEELRALLRGMDTCLVAYSGGGDSMLLAYLAHEALGNKALAVIADTPSLPRAELQEAIELSGRFGFALRVVKTSEFQNPDYVANNDQRCYFCKTELFTVLGGVARQEGFAVIVYGENASDAGDYRPGAQAAARFQVRAPLKEAGLTKAEIRELSRTLGLPTADKPQMACLSSRIPYGEAVTPEKLRWVELAEDALRERGFVELRVRHHELKQGALARIEVGPAELARFLAGGMAEEVGQALRRIGYAHVTLDLLGYRRGSLNEMLGLAAKT